MQEKCHTFNGSIKVQTNKNQNEITKPDLERVILLARFPLCRGSQVNVSKICTCLPSTSIITRYKRVSVCVPPAWKQTLNIAGSAVTGCLPEVFI